MAGSRSTRPGGSGETLTAQTAESLFDRLARRSLVVVSGKGGVGRTTMAALLGLACSARGRRVLVATTGHDDRLAWMMGAQRLSDTPQRVAGDTFIQRLVPRTCIREYGGLVLRNQKISNAVFDNRVVRKLLRAIPGLDGFAVLGKAWHEAIRGDAYDTVIFDGPATGHLLYTLGVPQTVLATVPKGPLTSEAELMQESFEDAGRVEALLVGLPETWPLTELSELGRAMRDEIRMNVAAIMVNALWPADVPPLQAPSGAVDPDGRMGAALERVQEVVEIGRKQRREMEAWSTSEAATACGADSLVEVPWRWQGLTDLESMRRMLDGLDASRTTSQAESG